jgi:hypothetical protein
MAKSRTCIHNEDPRVENFIDGINLSAQTTLRESIGRHELAQMITEHSSCIGIRLSAAGSRTWPCPIELRANVDWTCSWEEAILDSIGSDSLCEKSGLFAAQRDQGIGSSGATCRKVTGEQCDHREQQGNRGKSDWIKCFHAE